MTQQQQIDVNHIVTLLKERIGDLEVDKAVLTAQVRAMAEDSAEVKSDPEAELLVEANGSPTPRDGG